MQEVFYISIFILYKLVCAVSLLSIEKDMIMDIPDFNGKVIEKFAHQKERRMDFLFK